MSQAVLIARLIEHARRYGGVLTRADAKRLGANSRHLTALVRSQVFERPHPGVYVMRGLRGDHALAIRAAIASLTARSSLTARAPREAPAASHQSAAWLQGILQPAPIQVHLSADLAHHRRLGVVIHQSRIPFPLCHFQGIPCTPPARTLADLAAVLTPTELDDAVDRALAHRVVRMADLWAQTREPNAGRRGTERLRLCLEDRGDTAPHPSVLESRMSRLTKRAGLPLPKPEHIAGEAGQYRLDYAYPPQRVAVELHSYTWHHSPEQMAHDLARQRRLTLQGWTVLIYTWRDITREPTRVAAEIRTALRTTLGTGQAGRTGGSATANG